MKRIKFSINYNTRTCVVFFGLPFKPNCCLLDLPETKDGKKVVVLGLTPYTVEHEITGAL